VLKAFDNLVEWICLALMVVLCVDIFLGVFSRYIMGQTFTWYDEVARACFVWLVFLGAAVGVKRLAHFRLLLLTSRLSPLGQALVEFFTYLSMAAFAAVLIWQGWILAKLGGMQQTPVIGLPKSWIYASIPAGGALMILYAIAPAWRAVRAMVSEYRTAHNAGTTLDDRAH
jgi:TRAP-type C4-dicarboxylate transport system permease small subunit